MRIVIVTSEVTFVPQNYNLFLNSLFKNLNHDIDQIFALIVLKNNSPSLILKSLGMIVFGARKTGLQLMKNSIMSLALDHQKIASAFGIKTFYFKNPNDQEFIEFIKTHKIDLIINARTRFIYKRKILKTPSIGCFNIHHGILPKYRGTMCDLYAIFEKRPAGFSIHKMEAKIDSGDLILIKEVTQPYSEDKSHLNFCKHIENSSRIEGQELSRIIKEIKEKNNIPIVSQNISTEAIYSRNPNFKMIRRMIKNGVIL